jgi:hypothetical protein
VEQADNKGNEPITIKPTALHISFLLESLPFVHAKNPTKAADSKLKTSRCRAASVDSRVPTPSAPQRDKTTNDKHLEQSRKKLDYEMTEKTWKAIVRKKAKVDLWEYPTESA